MIILKWITLFGNLNGNFYNFISYEQRTPHISYEKMKKWKFGQIGPFWYVVLLVILNKCLYCHIYVKSDKKYSALES